MPGRVRKGCEALARRREEATLRLERRNSRSAVQQMQALDDRLGPDTGARRERTLLALAVAKEAENA